LVKRPKKHVCEDCGKEFIASATARFCPDCRRKRQQANSLAMRKCTVCGREFLGGPRSLYCKECRVQKQHENYKRYMQRRREGTATEIGKTVQHCEVCGKPFVVMGGGQRYCPDCAKEAYKESDRRQSRAWAERDRAERERR